MQGRSEKDEVGYVYVFGLGNGEAGNYGMLIWVRAIDGVCDGGGAMVGMCCDGVRWTGWGFNLMGVSGFLFVLTSHVHVTHTRGL